MLDLMQNVITSMGKRQRLLYLTADSKNSHSIRVLDLLMLGIVPDLREFLPTQECLYLPHHSQDNLNRFQENLFQKEPKQILTCYILRKVRLP